MNRFSYGKLVDGQLEYPPDEFYENDMVIVGFTADFLLAHGYKPVVYSDCPEDGTVYDATYTDNGDSIVQTWTPQT